MYKGYRAKHYKSLRENELVIKNGLLDWYVLDISKKENTNTYILFTRVNKSENKYVVITQVNNEYTIKKFEGYLSVDEMLG